MHTSITNNLLPIGPPSVKKSKQDEDARSQRAGASLVERKDTSKLIAQASPARAADAGHYQTATRPVLSVAEQLQDEEDLQATQIPDRAQLSGTDESHTDVAILLPAHDQEHLQDVEETATGQKGKLLRNGTKEAAAKAAVSSRNSQIWMSRTQPSAQKCNDN